jgi:hypothetical protein
MGRRPGIPFRFFTPSLPAMATCTRAVALTTISKFSCATHFGQIVALLIQRGQAAPSFATEAELKTLASWTALLTAPDATKVIKTPEFPGFAIPGSEPQYADENSNNSIDGLGYFTGFNSVKATGKFVGIPSDIRSQLSLIEDESRPGLNPGTTTFPITGDGRLIYDKDPVTSVIRGIPFVNFYLGSLSTQGFKALNENAFGLNFTGDWDKNVQIVKPDFNPRTEL